MYSEALMINAFQDGLVPEMIANIDASSFFCPDGNAPVRRLIIKNEADPSPPTVE